VGDAAMDIESKITTVQSQVNIVKALYPAKKPLYLTMDEWGTFGQSMREVLALTMNLNSFIRHADFVKMSDFTMLTSLLSTDKDKGTFKSPFFYAYKLFSNNCLGSSVDTQVICDTFDAKVNKGIPFLDVTTVYSKADGKIYINVANRNQNKAITADIFSDASSFSGKAVASQICYSLDDKFVYAADNVYAPVKKNIDTKANKMTFAFPAHSFTQIAVNVK
jgi:alpha-N-arabinofuranosidase